MAVPRENEQYLFNLNGIVKYLRAANHAAALHDNVLVDKILLELSSHRTLIESTTYYDVFRGDIQNMDEVYWDLFVGFINNLQGFDSVNSIMFLQDWACHVQRLSYSIQERVPLMPVREEGESQEYFMFRIERYCKDINEWQKVKSSPMPQKPIREKGEEFYKYIRRDFEYRKQIKLWNMAKGADLQVDTFEIKRKARKECRDWNFMFAFILE